MIETFTDRNIDRLIARATVLQHSGWTVHTPINTSWLWGYTIKMAQPTPQSIANAKRERLLVDYTNNFARLTEDQMIEFRKLAMETARAE